MSDLVQSMSLFDARPIKLDGFTLTARGVDVVGRPGPTKWIAAMNFAMASEECSPFWVGALWNYAESRDDWRAQLQQMLGDLGRPLTLKTLQNHGAIDKAIVAPAKAVAPSLAHADVVTGLEAADQVRWLTKARDEEMSVRDLRIEIRATRRRRILEGQATLAGMYRVWYADPPWPYSDRQPSGSNQSDHYPPMSIEEMCKLPVAAHATPHAVLFMWTTAPLILENPGVREVGEAWDFTYKTQMIWDKVDHNAGHYTGAQHEILTIWTRGECLPDIGRDLPDSVQVIRRRTLGLEHSGKPEDFRKIIEKLYTVGPYIELFGREPVEGWDVFGNDARLWTEQVSA